MKKWKRLYDVKGTFVCPYCLKELPINEATRDHKNPLSRFNDRSPENIEIVCKTCNNEKGALTVEEYILWKKLNDLRNGKVKK